MKTEGSEPVSASSLGALIAAYRQHSGHYFTQGEKLAFVGVTLASLCLGTWAPKISASVIILTSWGDAVAGALLGVSVAAFALVITLSTQEFLLVLKKANVFPEIFAPFWVAGLAWVITSVVFLLARLEVTWSLPLIVGRIVIAVIGVTIGSALIFTYGLFPISMRFLEIRAELAEKGTRRGDH